MRNRNRWNLSEFRLKKFARGVWENWPITFLWTILIVIFTWQFYIKLGLLYLTGAAAILVVIWCFLPQIEECASFLWVIKWPIALAIAGLALIGFGAGWKGFWITVGLICLLTLAVRLFIYTREKKEAETEEEERFP